MAYLDAACTVSVYASENTDAHLQFCPCMCNFFFFFKLFLLVFPVLHANVNFFP